MPFRNLPAGRPALALTRQDSELAEPAGARLLAGLAGCPAGRSQLRPAGELAHVGASDRPLLSSIAIDNCHIICGAIWASLAEGRGSWILPVSGQRSVQRPAGSQTAGSGH